AQKSFGRVYFADLTGSGISGLLVLATATVVPPEHLLLVPLLLWSAGSVLWFAAGGRTRAVAWVGAVAAGCALLHIAAREGSPATVTAELAGGSYLQPTSALLPADRLDLLGGREDVLVWATLGIASIAALSLVLLPLMFGWRSIFARHPGKLRTIAYFACLG